jgi:hypothetical protein
LTFGATLFSFITVNGQAVGNVRVVNTDTAGINQREEVRLPQIVVVSDRSLREHISGGIPIFTTDISQALLTQKKGILRRAGRRARKGF